MPTPDLSMFRGVPNGTYQQASDDTVGGVGIATAKKYKDGLVTGRKAVYARIYVEDASIRVAFGGTAPTVDIGEIYGTGTMLELYGWDMINTFRMISDTGATPANCNITVFF